MTDVTGKEVQGVNGDFIKY